MQRETVKITRSTKATMEILKEAIQNAGLRGERQVFVKPNMSHTEFVPGVVTDPVLLGELVGLLRDGASEVTVGESNGFNYPCQSAFEKTGIENAVKAAGGTIINLSDDKLVKVKFPDSNSPLKELTLPHTVLEADAVVDLTLMKTHEFAVYSGAIKNLFGCVPSNKRIYLHPYLHEVLYRLYVTLKPRMTVMDARTALEGNGPTKGTPVEMNLILTSNSALATDIVASKIMGLQLDEILYLRHTAKKTGLTEENIKVEGVQIAEVSRQFTRPRIDLPVRAQMAIYKHEFLTKVLFCQLDLVRLFQKVTMMYRGETTKT